jgi:hypothetical protein
MGGARGGWSCFTNYLHYPFNILQNFIIPKPQYGEAPRGQPIVPFFVNLLLLGMLAAVQFYHHPDLVTKEVDYILTNRFLPSKP